MTISTFERNATIAEMAVEIDRRGAVIEQLEAAVDTLTAALAAEKQRADDEAAAATDDFEHYVRNLIDNGPEPLRRLGEYLTTALDEDLWTGAELMLLGIGKLWAEREAFVASETVRANTATKGEQKAEALVATLRAALEKIAKGSTDSLFVKTAEIALALTSTDAKDGGA